MLHTGLHHPPALCNLHISLCPDHRLSRLRLFVLYRSTFALSITVLNIYIFEISRIFISCQHILSWPPKIPFLLQYSPMDSPDENNISINFNISMLTGHKVTCILKYNFYMKQTMNETLWVQKLQRAGGR